MTQSWMQFCGKAVIVTDKLPVPTAAMSCPLGVVASQIWYEVAPVSAVQVSVAMLRRSVDHFAGAMIVALPKVAAV